MPSTIPRHHDPALTLTLMKFAFLIFGKELEELRTEEYTEALRLSRHELQLHMRILFSEAACGIIIPEKTILMTLKCLQAEHGGEDNFTQHLHRHNLLLDDYITVLRNDLTIEAIISRVAFRAPTTSDQEIQDYYHHHLKSFCFSEQRSTRLILISTENQYSHLPQDSPRRRVMALHSRLQLNPRSFCQEAHLHSDCTTAIDGGDLGRISPGELCAPLDHALFQLAVGEISPIIQTTRGFHILFCEAIHPGQHRSIHEAYHQIHQILSKEKRMLTCKNWLKSLLAPYK